METNNDNIENNIDDIELNKLSKKAKKPFEQPIKRNFVINDADLLAKANVFEATLTEDLADFNAFDSSFDANFLLNLHKEVKDAFNLEFDSHITAVQAQYTDAVKAEMKLCIGKYAEVKHFVGKAFNDETQKVHYYEIGAGNLAEARTNPAQMVLFMTNLYKKANKYATQLIAQGYTQAKINETLTLRDNLLEAASEQDGYMKTRPLSTQTRVMALNKINNILSHISAAAEIVYANDHARRKKYIVNK